MSKIPTVKAVVINGSALTTKVTIPNTERYKYRNMDRVIDKNKWDSKTGTCKKGHKDQDAINFYIADERNKLIRAFEEDKAKGVVFTEAHILARLNGSYLDITKDFYAFCREQIRISNYKPESRRTYLSEVTKMEGKYPVLTFADINYKWLQEYEQYLRNEKSNHDNTVWKTFKFLNTMFNTAIKIGGIVDVNPFAKYSRTKYKQGIPLYLEWNEILKLYKTIKEEPMKPVLKLTGYYTLLSYFSGLRFSDAIRFDYSKQVMEGETGKRLVLYAQKTGEIVSVGFTKYISEVVDYIKDKPLKITNQEFNDNLKRIADMAKLGKDISSHTARHSYSMRCAELGMSIDDVQKLLGHGQRKSTEIYFKIKGHRLDDAMSLWDK